MHTYAGEGRADPLGPAASKDRAPDKGLLVVGVRASLLKSIAIWGSSGPRHDVCPASGSVRDALTFPGCLWLGDKGGAGLHCLSESLFEFVIQDLKFELFSCYNIESLCWLRLLK